jgi:hypothetical protein
VLSSLVKVFFFNGVKMSLCSGGGNLRATESQRPSRKCQFAYSRGLVVANGVDIIALPQEPESLEKMKARFPAALAEFVDAEEIVRNPAKAPSKNRKHVFDFADGMRLIVSTDIIEKKVLVHVSVSGDARYAKSINNSREEFDEDLWLRLAALLGHRPPGSVQHFFSKGGVLHLFFRPCDFGLKLSEMI